MSFSSSDSGDKDISPYVVYGDKKKIDKVSLADYGPKGIMWYPWALILVVLTRYSAPRPDYLFDKAYMKHHWKYWCTLFAIWLVPLIIPLNATPGSISLGMVVFLMFVGWFMPFPVSWFILEKRKWYITKFESRATALQVWETILWFGWYTQAVAIAAISLLDFHERKLALPQDFYDNTLVVIGGLALLIIGSGIKMYCAYLSGLNNYYYYDMILGRPNERFVDSGLYKYFSSPTYHIGYIDGYGAALLAGYFQRGSPELMLIFTLISHVSISFVNKAVEQPSVNEMYLTPKPCLGDLEANSLTRKMNEKEISAESVALQ